MTKLNDETVKLLAQAYLNIWLAVDNEFAIKALTNFSNALLEEVQSKQEAVGKRLTQAQYINSGGRDDFIWWATV